MTGDGSGRSAVMANTEMRERAVHRAEPPSLEHAGSDERPTALELESTEESTPYDPERRAGYLRLLGVFAGGSALASAAMIRAGSTPPRIGPPSNRREAWS